MRRLTVDVGILRRRAAFEKPLASTTWAKMISELRSDIAFPMLENHSTRSPVTDEETHIVGSRTASALGNRRGQRPMAVAGPARNSLQVTRTNPGDPRSWSFVRPQ